MNCFVRFYNIMAELIRAILDQADENFFDRYSAISEARNRELETEIKDEFPELMAEGHMKEIRNETYFDENFFTRMRQYSQKALSEKQLQLLVSLLTKLDQGLSAHLRLFQSEQEIQGLNANIEQTQVQLLPRRDSYWEHTSRGKNHKNDMNVYLRYAYCIDLNRTGNYKIFHRFLSPSVFSDAVHRRRLRIGMSPVTFGAQLSWNTKEVNGTGYFYITDLKGKDIIQSNCLSIWERAVKEEVDILVFPEMLGYPGLTKAFQEKMSVFPEFGQAYPALTILPSIWMNERNTAIMLDEQGDIILKQNKQHSFPYCQRGQNRLFLEGIRPDHEIHVLHCQGIGRMVIAVCRDALITEYMSLLLNIIKSTLLIIPSFSTGSYDFGEMIDGCRTADCCVCWINTCSAYQLLQEDLEQKVQIWESDKLEEIGMFLRTGRRSMLKNGRYACKRSSMGCCGQDSDLCRSCLFIQDVAFA